MPKYSPTKERNSGYHSIIYFLDGQVIFLIIIKNNHLTLLSIAVLIDSNDLNDKMPFLSALAQLVEQMTVNHWVAGSSPAAGAKFKKAA